MVRPRYIVPLAVAALATLLCKPGAALTEQQAVDAARTFLQAIGRQMPSSEPEVAVCAEGWRPGAFKVEFGRTLRIDISRSTGNVVALFDASAVPNKAAASPISQSEARRLATEYMTAAGGIPEGARFLRVNPLLGEPPEDPAIWQVIWDRYVDDVLVCDDTLNVQIDASTGALIGFSNNFVLPAPQAGGPSISRVQAIASAAASSDHATDKATAETVIVDPDALRGAKAKRWRSAFAWAVTFPDRVSAIVDGATGEVLSVVRPLRRAAASVHHDVRADLRQAAGVRALLGSEVVADVDLRRDAKLREALLDCIGPHFVLQRTRAMRRYDYTLEVRLPNGDSTLYVADHNYILENRDVPARRWRWCSKSYSLLGLPVCWGARPATQQPRVDIFSLLDKATAAEVDAPAPRRTGAKATSERPPIVTVDLTAPGLKEALASCIHKKALVYEYSTQALSRTSRDWGLHLMVRGRRLAGLIWRECSTEGGIVWLAGGRNPAPAWETCGGFGRILEPHLPVPAAYQPAQTPQSPGEDTGSEIAQPAATHQAEPGLGFAPVTKARGTGASRFPPAGESEQSGDASRFRLWLWIVLAGFLVAAIAACAVWARARRQA